MCLGGGCGGAVPGRVGPRASWTGPGEHKELLCRFSTDSHAPYRVADIAWPALDPASRGRLAALPIWEEAVRTEAMTAQAVLAMGRAESDPRPAPPTQPQRSHDAP